MSSIDSTSTGPRSNEGWRQHEHQTLPHRYQYSLLPLVITPLRARQYTNLNLLANHCYHPL